MQSEGKHIPSIFKRHTYITQPSRRPTLVAVPRPVFIRLSNSTFGAIACFQKAVYALQAFKVLRVLAFKAIGR